MFSADFGNRWGEPCYKAYKGRSEKCENCPVEKTFNDGYSHYSEEIWTINGSERHIIVRTAPVTDQSGGILAVMEMCSDVTELKMLENRLAILGETIAGTSHAIKNILSGLEGGVYVVDSGFRSQNEQRMTTGWVMVKKNVGMISELVKDILYASKDRKPELKAVDPGQVLGNLIELFDEKAGKEGIRLVKAFDDKMGEALLDPQGIHTLLSNLITNAMAACAENRGASAPQIILSARVEDALLIIEVADTGPGMSEDVKDNLFKKFYSTKGAKGTGLGLLVSRKIVDENGGTITCESELGRGTKFIVRLPFKKPGQETAERSVEVN
jgi:signal transduction histidine kinase